MGVISLPGANLRKTWNVSWNKCYEECCTGLNWLSLRKHRDLKMGCQIYKIVSHLDCNQFDNYFSLGTSKSHSLSSALQCCQSRTNSFRHSFFVHAPFLWNIINSSSYSSFKTELHSFLLQQHPF